MSYIYYIVRKMKHHLNLSKQDPNYIMLKEIFNFIDSRKSKEIISSFGTSPIETFRNDLKIRFISIMFNYELSFVIDELNNNSRLRKFCGIKQVPTVKSIETRFSRFNLEQYVNIMNKLIKTNFKRKNNRKMTFIVDATPVDVDYNTDRKHRTRKYLENKDYDWAYSSSKGYYIGYKVTIVLEKESLTPVLILIHSGSPHDSKLFPEILENLKKHKIIRPGDTLLFDRGYYSYKNYRMGIMKYKIVPFIFPKVNFNKNKLMSTLCYPLELFRNNKRNKKLRQIIKKVTNQLLRLLKHWKDFKPIRGYIEDFFKVCKQAFNMHKIHTYTLESFTKNIFTRVLLITKVIDQTDKTKTALQKLSQM